MEHSSELQGYLDAYLSRRLAPLKDRIEQQDERDWAQERLIEDLRWKVAEADQKIQQLEQKVLRQESELCKLRILTLAQRVTVARSALLRLYAFVALGPAKTSARHTRQQLPTPTPPDSWPSSKQVKFRNFFDDSAIAVLSQQRHRHAHAFTAKQLKVVIEMGPEDSIDSDAIELLQMAFEDITSTTWDDADQCQLRYDDRSSELKAHQKKQNRMARLSTKATAAKERREKEKQETFARRAEIKGQRQKAKEEEEEEEESLAEVDNDLTLCSLFDEM
ncbi:unnamed protein product [Sympodiomycopsis kandeliae]